MDKNSVENLIGDRFLSFTSEQQIEIKRLGRPTPDMSRLTTIANKGKTEYLRHFNTEYYDKHKWLCGCDKRQSVFCFPCLCYGGNWSWTLKGVTHLGHLTGKIKRHENSFIHIQNEFYLNALGTVKETNADRKDEIRRHNREVDKNRYVLDKIVNCVKFCGAHNLPLHGVFRGVVEFGKDLDANFRGHFENSTAFKGTLETMRDDLMHCMWLVARKRILLEIETATFVSVIVGGTADVSDAFQSAVIFRYVTKGRPVERFWGFLSHDGPHDAASSLLSEINLVLKGEPLKLIAQSYDGTADTSGTHVAVKELYPYAYHVHCYAHRPHSIMARAVSRNKEVAMFFANLSEISDFFANAPPSVTAKALAGVRSDFGDTLRVVYACRSEMIECADEIMESSRQTLTNVSRAGWIKRMLTDSVFYFWLTVFHELTPHVDRLYDDVQCLNADPVRIRSSVERFEREMTDIRNNVTDIVVRASNVHDARNATKRRLESDEDVDDPRKSSVLEVCDWLTVSAKDRLWFTSHLTAAQLFKGERYPEYTRTFPLECFQCTVECYPFCDTQRLKTELEFLYVRNEFRILNGVMATLTYITSNDMDAIFREVLLLLNILGTTSTQTLEAASRFPMLSRIKTCLRSATGQENKRLNALTMVSVESEMMSDDVDFNRVVIDTYSKMKDRHSHFTYL